MCPLEKWDGSTSAILLNASWNVMFSLQCFDGFGWVAWGLNGTFSTNIQTQFTHEKGLSFINFGLHHYQPTQWLLTHSTHLSQHLCTYMHIVSFAVFIYYFNCISFAIRLSGHKIAIKLIDWLISCHIEKIKFIEYVYFEQVAIFTICVI